jgi:hypothetical protein
MPAINEKIIRIHPTKITPQTEIKITPNHQKLTQIKIRTTHRLEIYNNLQIIINRNIIPNNRIKI